VELSRAADPAITELLPAISFCIQGAAALALAYFDGTMQREAPGSNTSSDRPSSLIRELSRSWEQDRGIGEGCSGPQQTYETVPSIVQEGLPLPMEYLDIPGWWISARIRASRKPLPCCTQLKAPRYRFEPVKLPSINRQ
jgi:hypothetical protein